MSSQLPLFPDLTSQFPSTRYQGSKTKLVPWIWEQLADLDFDTCLDAFGGTGAVAYRLKQANKYITYNDILRFNFYIGKALIENSSIRLDQDDVAGILRPHSDISYPQFVQQTFEDTYFTDGENKWIDRTITNIRLLENPHKKALALFGLFQSCIIKRPYNLFHRKNLYIRLAEVKRSFGNKASWDKPFEDWFCHFINEANQAVFDNGRANIALNVNVLDISGKYDLVYIDPPYISKKGVATDYRDFYHFLEGLTMYDEWSEQIDYLSKHRRLQRHKVEWIDKGSIHNAFDKLFAHFHSSILVVSYRSDGIPSITELVHLLKQYKHDIRIEYYGQYKYALSKNDKSGEVLIIGL